MSPQMMQDQILDKANEAIAAGNIDEATELMKQIPLPPEVANSVKQVMGINFLREAGFDLSEAEARYGQAWLYS